MSEVVHPGRGSMRLMRTRDETVYLKMSKALLRAVGRDSRDPGRVEADVELFGDRWTEAVPSAPAVQRGIHMCEVWKQLPTELDEGEEIPEGELVSQNGRRLWAFTERTGDTASSLYITAGEPATVHKFRVTGGEFPFTAVFSDYGGPVGASHPPAEDALTREELQAAYRQRGTTG
ncbi:hypothetical protein ABT354_32930 [Streptomyces sp. NPDC000594]|uniref:hypothetical protein n=1 Tax=Streptomyces sp. NPDC000594 TaxID=3154261 RepID=UPI00332F26B0